jgi:hypothetical protein
VNGNARRSEFSPQPRNTLCGSHADRDDLPLVSDSRAPPRWHRRLIFSTWNKKIQFVCQFQNCKHFQPVQQPGKSMAWIIHPRCRSEGIGLRRPRETTETHKMDSICRGGSLILAILWLSIALRYAHRGQSGQ